MLKKNLTLTCCSFLAALMAFATTVVSPAAAATIEDMGIYRLRLYVKTCNLSGAGTNGAVYVRLKDADQRFYIDTPAADFQANTSDTFDIVMPTIQRVSQIQRLSIHNTSSDNLCISEVRLIINEGVASAFTRTYANGLWIGTNEASSSVLFNYAALRGSFHWTISGAQAAMCFLPTRISRAAMVERVETMVGDINRNTLGNALYWGGLHGGAFVGISRRSASSLDVDLDLKADIDLEIFGADLIKDPEVDVNMRMTETCDGTARRVRFDASLVSMVVSDGGLLQPVYNEVNDALKEFASEGGLNFNYKSRILPSYVDCPIISTDQDANVSIDWGYANINGTLMWVKDLPILCTLY